MARPADRPSMTWCPVPICPVAGSRHRRWVGWTAMTLFEVEGGPRLELPDEPVDIKDGLRDALLDGPGLAGRVQRRHLHRTVAVGQLAAGPRARRPHPRGVRRRGHRQPTRAVAVADGRPPVASLHHRAGRTGSVRRLPAPPNVTRCGRAIGPPGGRPPTRREESVPRVTVPDGQDPLVYVWTELAPPLTAAAGGLQQRRLREVLPVAPRVRGGPDHHGPHQPVRHLHRLAHRS